MNHKQLISSWLKFHLIMGLVIASYLMLYPYFKNDLNGYIEQLDSKLIDALNISDLSEISGYFTYIINTFILGYMIYFINIGLKLFQNEIVLKQVDYIYQLPQRRTTYLSKKLIYLSFNNILFMILTYLALLILINYLNVGSFNTLDYVVLLIQVLMVSLAFLSIGLVIGSISTKITNPLIISTSVALSFYLLQVASNLLKNDFLMYLNPYAFFLTSNINLVLLVVCFIILTTTLTWFSFHYFKRRDLS
ncbi:MAG: hypothetical protein ACRCTA_02195 [Bacilli bacterium]